MTAIQARAYAAVQALSGALLYKLPEYRSQLSEAPIFLRPLLRMAFDSLPRALPWFAGRFHDGLLKVGDQELSDDIRIMLAALSSILDEPEAATDPSAPIVEAEDHGSPSDSSPAEASAAG